MSDHARLHGALWLAVVSVVSGLALAFLPADLTRAQLVWEPTTQGDSGNLVLARGWPEQITARTTCSRLRESSTGLVLDAGGFSIERSGEKLAGLGLEVALPEDECDVLISFVASSGIALLQAGDAEASRALTEEEFPNITQLVTPTETTAPIESVTIETRPTGADLSVARLVLCLFTVGAGILAVVLSWLAFRRHRTESKAVSFRLKWVDLAVLVALGAAAFVLPTFDDDGFVAATVEAFSDRGVFTAFYPPGDPWLAQGLLVDVPLYVLFGAGLSFVGMRLALACLLAAAWVALRIFVAKPLLAEGQRSIWLLAAVFSAFASVWLIGLRSEPIVVACLVVCWAGLVSFVRKPGSLALFLGFAACGVALATHATGFVAVGPALVLGLAALRWCVRDRTVILPAITAVLAAASVTMVSVFALLDINTLRDSAADFQAATGSHSATIFDEILRYTRLFGRADAARLASVLILGVLLLVATLSVGRLSRLHKLVWIAAALSLLGLLATPSKWQWHLGAYAVTATVLAALAVAPSERPEVGKWPPRWSILLPGAVIAAGTAISIPGWASSTTTLVTRTWAEFAETVGPTGRMGLWLLALAAAFGLGVLADLRSEDSVRRTSVVVMSGIVLLPVGASGAWMALDTVESPNAWTQFRQNVRQVKGADQCGALSDTELVKGVDVLSVRKGGASNPVGLQQSGFPPIPNLANGPLDSVPTWGSWEDQDSGQGRPPEELVKRSPTFAVEQQTSLVVWTAGSDSEQVSATAVFSDVGDQQISEVPLPIAGADSWKLNPLPVPESATSVVLQVAHASPNKELWGAVSSPAVAQQQPAYQVLTDATTFAGPYDGMLYPCITRPNPVDGYWPRIDYFIAGASYWADGRWTGPQYELTLTDIGCSLYSGKCVLKGDYPQARVVTTSR